jgi:hypothetical protein
MYSPLNNIVDIWAEKIILEFIHHKIALWTKNISLKSTEKGLGVAAIL